MLKLALVFVFGAGTVFVANAGRVHHSGLQPQLFNGTAMKVAPDPSNAWSFHEQVTVSKGTFKHSVPVVVDFDHHDWCGDGLIHSWNPSGHEWLHDVVSDAGVKADGG